MPRRNALILVCLASFFLSACGVESDDSAPETPAPEAGAAPAVVASADPDGPARSGAVQTGPAGVSGADSSRKSAVPLKGLVAMNFPNVRLDRVLQGMSHPWAFEFLDADTVIVTELRGRLFRYRLDTGEGTEITGVPEVAQGYAQTGLLDVEVHPDFASNRRIYFSYVARAEPEGLQAVRTEPLAPHEGSGDGPDGAAVFMTVLSTAVIEGDRLVDLRTILAATPATWSPANFGGALEFDDQGKLYVSIGDRSERHLSQSGKRLQGKILRLNDDGSTPADNPFVGDPEVDDRIYALGVRNPQGLHFDVPSGRLFESEHGPMGGDEINLIEAGANYGWPIVTYGRNYTGEVISEATHGEGLVQPLFHFTPSIAVSPLAVYRGAQFPEWDGDLLVGALKDKHVVRLDLDGAVVRSAYPFLGALNARVRDVKVAADGSVYVLIQFGALYRLSRTAASEPEGAGLTGADIYALACAACHDSGEAGAPTLGQQERWNTIAAQDRATIDRHVLEGLRAMPERGGCYACSDAHLEAATDHMLERAGVTPAVD